jgi:type II secretory ATPase GspE/PulE/Tfp pilus assembly ATPase PilB-like protein
LVRKLCPDCKKKIILEGENFNLIKKIHEEINDTEKFPLTNEIYSAVGCDKCNNTGYKGRVGIFEAIFSDENIEKIVQQNPSEREIAKVAKAQGFMTMAEDGVIKILNGTTTIEEVERVIDLESGAAYEN